MQPTIRMSRISIFQINAASGISSVGQRAQEHWVTATEDLVLAGAMNLSRHWASESWPFPFHAAREVLLDEHGFPLGLILASVSSSLCQQRRFCSHCREPCLRCYLLEPCHDTSIHVGVQSHSMVEPVQAIYLMMQQADWL